MNKFKCIAMLSVVAVFATGAFAADAGAWVDSFPTADEWNRATFISVGQDFRSPREPDASGFVSDLVNEREVEKAMWYTTGLGVYEAHVNGREVGGFLKPGYTHVRKCRQATASDVTGLMDRSVGATNRLSAVVSASWWRDQVVGFAGDKSAFCGILKVAYQDGTTASFATDLKNWRGMWCGNLREASIYDGEVYDASEPAVWERDKKVVANAKGDRVFWPVRANTEFKGEIRLMSGGEIRLRDDLALGVKSAWVWKSAEGAGEGSFGKVVRLRAYGPGETIDLHPGETLVVDFGQNCAAVPEFAFSAARKAELTAVFAEMLNDASGEKVRGLDGPSGSVWRRNMRDSKSRLVYVFSGNGEERYRPSFTYYGYQYMSVTATAHVTIRSVRSLPVTSVSRSSENNLLETSDPDVNKLVSCIMWTLRSNYLSTSTDCPQRNERQGWTGDAQSFVPASLYAADTSAFLEKFCADMRDSQFEDGAFASVAPPGRWGNHERGVTGWADAGIFIPYRLWLFTGERRYLADNYAAMVRYMDWLDANDGPDPRYGDWLSLERRSATWNKPRRLENGDANVVYNRCHDVAYWIWDARTMAEIAADLGHSRDAARFSARARELTDHFRREFLGSDGTLLEKWKSQFHETLVLKLGLAPTKDAERRTLGNLVAGIRKQDGHLSTGFLGTCLLMNELTRHGASDVAYSLLLQKEQPSWLYNVSQGANTVWERWDSYSRETGFGGGKANSIMNSFNHYSLGSVLDWMYRTIGGINPDPKAPGFSRVILAPHPDRRLKWAKCRYQTPRGSIATEWRYDDDGKLHWTYSVPDGMDVEEVVPAGSIVSKHGKERK